MSQEDLDDIRRRLQAVERDAAATRVLAGAADRDGSEIRVEIRDLRRATTAGFNALRHDFVDLRQEFVDLRSHIDQRFEQVDRAAGQQRIVELIESLIDQQGH